MRTYAWPFLAALALVINSCGSDPPAGHRRWASDGGAGRGGSTGTAGRGGTGGGGGARRHRRQHRRQRGTGG